MYIEADQPQRAVDYLRPHLTANPDDVAALCLVSSAHLSLGERELSYAAAHRAVSLAPTAEHGWRLVAYSAAALGNRDEAVSAAIRSVDLAPQSWETHFTVAAVDNQLEIASARTRAAAEQAVRLAPENALCLVMLGDTELGLRQRAAARSAYEEALRLDPTNSTARNNLATTRIGPGAFTLSAGTAAAQFIDDVRVDPTSALSMHNLRVSVTHATLTVHRIVWIFFVAAHITFLPALSGGLLGDPPHGPPVRWAIAALSTITLIAYGHALRRQLRHRLRMFIDTARDFNRRLTAWVIAIASAYAFLLAAAVAPAPYFRAAYAITLVSLVAGMLQSVAIKRQLEKELASVERTMWA